MWSIRVAGWGKRPAQALAGLVETMAVPDRASDGAALLASIPREHGAGGGHPGPRRGRRIRAQPGPRRQPRNPLYGHRRRPGGPDRALSSSRGCNAPARSNPRCRCPTFSVRSRVPACSRSSPTCPARAARPASPGSTSCRPTRRRSGRARRRSRPIAERRRPSPGLSRRRGDEIARGDRPRVRPRSRAHRVRRRLRRPPQPAGARLSRRRRRGDPHHPRLPGLSDRDAGRRRQARGRRREEPHRRCRCHPRRGDGTHPDRIPRQSEQSDRHLRARSTRSSACIAACRRARYWCSMPPMPNTSGATTTNPASSWWRPRKTS